MKDQGYDNRFGLVLKRWIFQRFSKYEAAAFSLGVHKTNLSQVINGHRFPSDKLKSKLVEFGFDKNNFALLEGTKEIKKDLLDYEEMKFLYLELKMLLEEKNTIISILEKKIQELQKKVGGKW